MIFITVYSDTTLVDNLLWVNNSAINVKITIKPCVYWSQKRWKCILSNFEVGSRFMQVSEKETSEFFEKKIQTNRNKNIARRRGKLPMWQQTGFCFVWTVSIINLLTLN